MEINDKLLFKIIKEVLETIYPNVLVFRKSVGGNLEDKVLNGCGMATKYAEDEKTESVEEIEEDVTTIDVTEVGSTQVVSSIEDIKVVLDLCYNGSMTLEEMGSDGFMPIAKTSIGKPGYIPFSALDKDVNIHLLNTDVLEGKTKPLRDVNYHQPYFVDGRRLDGEPKKQYVGYDKGCGSRTNYGGMNPRGVPSEFNDTKTGINLLWMGATHYSVNYTMLRKSFPVNSVYTQSNEHGQIQAPLEFHYKNLGPSTPVVTLNYLPDPTCGTDICSYFTFNNFALERSQDHQGDVEKERRYYRGKGKVECIHNKDQVIDGNYIITQSAIGDKITINKFKRYEGISHDGIYTSPFIYDNTKPDYEKLKYTLDQSLSDEIVDGIMENKILFIPTVDENRWLYSKYDVVKTQVHKLKSPCDGMDYGKMVFRVSEDMETASKPLYYRNFDQDHVSEVRDIGLNPYLRHIRHHYLTKTGKGNTKEGDMKSVKELERRLKNLVGNRVFSIEFYRINFSRVEEDDPVLKQFLKEGDDGVFLEIDGEVMSLQELKSMKERVSKINLQPDIRDMNFKDKEDTFRVLEGVKDYVKERKVNDYYKYGSVCFYKVRRIPIKHMQGSKDVGKVFVDRVSKIAYAWEQDVELLKTYRHDVTAYRNMGLIYVNNHNHDDELYTNFYGQTLKLKAKYIPKLKNGVYRIVDDGYVKLERSDYEILGIVDDPQDVALEVLANWRKLGKKTQEEIREEMRELEMKKREFKYILDMDKLTVKNLELQLDNKALKTALAKVSREEGANITKIVAYLKSLKDLGGIGVDIFNAVRQAVYY